MVCSGVKSILDIPATLEALETRGVPVLGYRTADFPAFTTVTSGQSLEWRVETPAEAAAVVRSHRLPGASRRGRAGAAGRGRGGGRGRSDGNGPRLRPGRGRARGLSGKAITPFLLDAVRRATGGRSLAANRALIVANARLAAEVAVAIRS